MPDNKPKKEDPKVSVSKQTLFTLHEIDKRLKNVEDLVERLYSRRSYK